MKFAPEMHEGRIIGHSLRLKNVLFFFGLGETTEETLKAHFPRADFAFLKQVHGSTVVESAAAARPEADGHFTSKAGLAPVVVTADCIPVLLASDSRVAAVHAGWRGVAADVIGAAAAHFDDDVTFAAIGPHLARRSFEVGRDVADRLLSAAPDKTDHLVFPHADPNKVYFDLTALARTQIHHAFGDQVRVTEFVPDTLTSPEYHSYRRAGGHSGRNLSFVVRNA